MVKADLLLAMEFHSMKLPRTDECLQLSELLYSGGITEII